MTSLDPMVACLKNALRYPTNCEATLAQFQSLVWDCKKGSIPAEIYDVLADLAYDLNFFVPDPGMQMQDPSYYGYERLEKEIRAALRQLADVGVKGALD